MRILSVIKALSFVAVIIAALLSCAGYNDGIVATVGCVSAITFFCLVSYDIYKAMRYED